MRSHQRALAAIEAGRFADEITPLTFTVAAPRNERIAGVAHDVTFAQDEGPRRDTSRGRAGEVAPGVSRDRHGDRGQLVSDERRRGRGDRHVRRGGEAIAVSSRWRGSCRFATAGVEPERFGIGPVPAVRKVLARAGLTLDQIDLVELNEAFAAQVLACLRDLPIDPDRLNVNGGAIALGHPLGCTGAKLTTSLLYEMRRRKARYGLVTMCVGGGMGAAGIFERYDDFNFDFDLERAARGCSKTRRQPTSSRRSGSPTSIG